MVFRWPHRVEPQILCCAHQLQLLVNDLVLALVDRILEEMEHSETHCTRNDAGAMPTHGLFWDGLLQVLVHFATPSPLPTWRFRYTALQSDAGSGVKGGAMSESKRGARAKVGRLAERVRKVLDEGADAAQEIHKKVINLPLALPIPAEVEGIGRNESASDFLR